MLRKIPLLVLQGRIFCIGFGCQKVARKFNLLYCTNYIFVQYDKQKIVCDLLIRESISEIFLKGFEI